MSAFGRKLTGECIVSELLEKDASSGKNWPSINIIVLKDSVGCALRAWQHRIIPGAAVAASRH